VPPLASQKQSVRPLNEVLGDHAAITMVKRISAGESAPTLANTQIAIHSNLRNFEKPIERRIAL